MSILVARYATFQRFWLALFLLVACIILIKPLWQLVINFQATPDFVLTDFYSAESIDQHKVQISKSTSHILIPQSPSQSTKLVFRVFSAPPLPARDLLITYNQQNVATLPVNNIPRIVYALVPVSSTSTQGFLITLQTTTIRLEGNSHKLGLTFTNIQVQHLKSKIYDYANTLLLLVFGITIAILTRVYRISIKERAQFIFSTYKVSLDYTALLVLAFCSIYAVTASYLSLTKHRLFLTNAYDLGIYDQTLWLISQGKIPYNTTMGIHLLGNHASFLVYMLSLLYLVVPDVRALLIFQSIIIALGGWLLYQIGKDKYHAQAGVVVAAIYLLHPATQNMNLFDFHPDTIASTAIIAAFWLAERRNWLWMFIMCAIVLAAKEHFALTMVGFGIYLLFYKKYYPGLLLIIISLIWFSWVTQKIQPFYNGLGRSVHLDRYSIYGSGISGIIKTLIIQPNIFLHQILQSRTVSYLFYLTLPFVFLCWFNIRVLIVSIPIITLNILTDYNQQTGMQFHYDALVIPTIAFASLNTLIYIIKYLTNRKNILLLYSCIALCTLLITRNDIALTTTRIINLHKEQNGRMLLYNYVISLIPPHASVSAQSRIQPHLSHGEQVFLFPTPFTNEGLVNKIGMPFTPNIDYIIYDSEVQLSSYTSDKKVRKLLEKTYEQQLYVSLVNLDGIILLKRENAP